MHLMRIYERLGGTVVTRLPLTAMAWVRLWAWWRCGNTFTSHCYGLGSTPTPGHMWDKYTLKFHPSQPMPDGVPLGVFLYPQNGSKLFRLECLIRPIGLARTCYVKSAALPLLFYLTSQQVFTELEPFFILADSNLSFLLTHRKP